MTEREDALLNAAVDGELTSAERIELEHLLTRSEEARVRLHSLQRLVDMVEELGSAAPPEEFSRVVASIVWNGKSTTRQGGFESGISTIAAPVYNDRHEVAAAHDAIYQDLVR